MRCVICGSRGLTIGTVSEDVEVGALRYAVELKARVCPDCHEDFVDAEDLRAVEQVVAEALAREGRRTPQAFRYMRKAIGLKANEVAQLLDVTPETVSRWENGGRQPETRAVKLLGLLVLEHCAGKDDVHSYLRSLAGQTPGTSTHRSLIAPVDGRP